MPSVHIVRRAKLVAEAGVAPAEACL
jgi:hypothetical protein